MSVAAAGRAAGGRAAAAKTATGDASLAKGRYNTPEASAYRDSLAQTGSSEPPSSAPSPPASPPSSSTSSPARRSSSPSAGGSVQRLASHWAGTGGGPVDTGAGFMLGLLFWGWIALPFLRGGPGEVRKVLKAKFLNRTPGGEWLP